MPYFVTQGVRHYLLALQFFTRIPVAGRLAHWVGFSPAMLRASAAHFPGVGWLLGIVQALLGVLLLRCLPAGPQTPLVVASLGCVVGLLLTGAFHEDGLADVADGLGGSYDRVRALEIMKDSRVGAFGAIAVAMALLLRVALLAQLASLGPAVLVCSLFLAHVTSRSWPLCTIRLLVHVGDVAGSKSKPLADQISGSSLFVAALWCGTAVALSGLLATYCTTGAVYLGHAAWLALVLGGGLGSALAWLWSWRWFARRLQGFTGDCLGATQQVCELAFYLGVLLAWPGVV